MGRYERVIEKEMSEKCESCGREIVDRRFYNTKCYNEWFKENLNEL